MIAFGNKSNFEYLTCLNHTIHLSVLAALFPKKKNLIENDSEVGMISDDDLDEILQEDLFILKPCYLESIERMTKIIRFFRTSPVRNDLLQEVSKRQNGKQLQLILFTKTRWNSIVISAKRFITMLPAISATLDEIGSEGLQWDIRDTKTLKVFLFMNN